MTSTDVVAFANELILKVAPSTVGTYLSHLGAVFAVAKAAWAYPLDQTAMKDAFVVAKRLGIASKSRERDRRPTLEELDKILGIRRTAEAPTVLHSDAEDHWLCDIFNASPGGDYADLMEGS